MRQLIGIVGKIARELQGADEGLLQNVAKLQGLADSAYERASRIASLIDAFKSHTCIVVA